MKRLLSSLIFVSAFVLTSCQNQVDFEFSISDKAKENKSGSSNKAPVYLNLSCNNSSFTEGDNLTCSSSATDQDGDTLTWSLDSSNTCTHAVVNASNGSINQTLHNGFVGSCTLAIKANDGTVDSNVLTQAIVVANSPALPTLTIADVTVAEDSGVIADATSSEGDFGTYALVNATTTGTKCSDQGTLSIDATTGVVSLVAPNYNGVCNVKVSYDDGNGSPVVEDEFQVTITAVNDGPVISGSCLSTGTQGVAYSCTGLSAVDPEGNAFTWELDPTNACSWAVVDTNTGTISGTPIDDELNCDLVVRANDGSDPSATSYSLTMNITNVAPTLTFGNTSIQQGTSLTAVFSGGDVQASEEGYGTYSLDNASAVSPKCSDNGNLIIDSFSGEISFEPDAAYTGTCNLTVVFDDGNSTNNTVSETSQITVVVANVPEAATFTAVALSDTEIKLDWTSGGGTTTGFRVAYQTGRTAPADCVSGTNSDVGNVSTTTITGLSQLTIYSFRLCSYNAGADQSIGKTLTSKTFGPSGWEKKAFIKANNSEASDSFGGNVGIDGDTIIVGAPGESSSQTTITNGTGTSADNSIVAAGAVYIYRNSGGWTQEAYIKPPNLESQDYFGYDVDISGNTIVVGAPQEDSSQNTITNGAGASSDNSSSDSGAVYVFVRSGTTWSQQAYIKAPNNDVGDKFGFSVNIDGDTLAVGAPYEDSTQNTITNGPTASADNSGDNNGALYVFKRTGTAWAQEAYIKTANTDNSDQLTGDVGQPGLGRPLVYVDNDTIAVASIFEGSLATGITNGPTASADNTGPYSGAVYVYKRTGTSWAQEAYINADNASSPGYFGVSLGISGDTMAIGFPLDASNQTTITNGTGSSSDTSVAYNGAVFIYKRSGTTWAQEAYIKPPVAAMNIFGAALALDGDILAVGAAYENSNATGVTNSPVGSSDTSIAQSGAVFTFARSGTSWSQTSFIKADFPDSNDLFGGVMDLSGNTLVVGSMGESSNLQGVFGGGSADNSNAQSGAVYVYGLASGGLSDPVGLAATNTDYNSITIGWTKSTSVTNYKIAYQTGPTAPADCNSGTVITTLDVDSFTLTGLSAGEEYSFRVCSYDDVSTTTTGIVTTASAIRYANEATNFEIQSKTTTSLNLSWSSGGYQTGYILAYQAGATAPADCDSGTSSDLGNVSSANVSGLSEDSQYSFRLCAYETLGNRTTGAILTGKTKSLYWNQVAYIKASNADNNDNFGSALAMSGNTIAVGAMGESSNQQTITNGATSSSDNSANNSGAVYVYRKAGENWAQEAYIKSTNSDSYDEFGTSVTLEGDYLLVGARYEDSSQNIITNGTTASTDDSLSGSGAAYLYKRTGTSWAQEAYIKASNVDGNDQFGTAVSISNNLLAISARYEDSNQTVITNGATASGNNISTSTGAVYVYKKSSSEWIQEAYIKPTFVTTYLSFGNDISLDGNRLAVGAIYEDSQETRILTGGSSKDSSAYNSGAVYLFKREDGKWSQEAYVKPSNTDDSDYFGQSLSLSGNRLAVAAPSEDGSQRVNIYDKKNVDFANNGSSVGAVYIFEERDGVWTQDAYIKALNSDDNDLFGFDVALQGDTLAVSAPIESSNQRRITNTATVSHDNSQNTTGAVYLYRKNGSAWNQTAYVKTSNGDSYDTFGKSIALEAETLVVGATGESSNQVTITNSDEASTDNSIGYAGAVYVFTNENRLFEVTNLKIARSDGQIDLSWDPLNFADGYRLAYQVGSTAPYDCNSGTQLDLGSSISTSITGLTVGEVYSFRLCTYKGTNYSFGKVRNDIKASAESSGTQLLGWAPEAYIKAANANSNDQFGVSVSIYQDTIAVGAQYESSNLNTITNGASASTDNNLGSSGATYVYKRTGSTWAQEAFIKASNANSGDNFGWDVSVHGDTLVVGVPYEDSNVNTITNGATSSTDNSAGSSGAVYVYKRTGVNWAQEAFIKASNAELNDWFGYSVSVDEDTLVVGAYGEDSPQTTITNGVGSDSANNSFNRGAAYVYKRTGSTWAQEAYVKSFNNGSNDQFGYDVSVSGDYLIVGAFNEDSNQSTIINGEPSSVVGDTGFDNGATYIYKRTGTTWVHNAYIKPSNNDNGDQFGIVVDIDGDTVVVGALVEDSNQSVITNGPTSSADNSTDASGAAYIYKNTRGVWYQEAYLKASNSESQDYFGSGVAISGNTVVVGAYGEDSSYNNIINGEGSSSDNVNLMSGAVYVYKRDGSSWTQDAYIKANNTGPSDEFGKIVDIYGDTVIVGSKTEDSNTNSIVHGVNYSTNDFAGNSGIVYVYRNTNRVFDVAGLKKTINSTSSITLNWSQVPGASGYKIAYQPGATSPSDCNSGTVVDVGNVSTYTINSIVGGPKVSFRVCSYDASNNESSGLTFTEVLETTFAPEASGLAVTDSEKNSLTLSWTSGGGITTGFKLAYLQGDTPPTTCDLGTSVTLGNVSTYTISGLDADSRYGIRLCSLNANGADSVGVSLKGKTLREGWNQEAYIKSPTATFNKYFGRGLDLDKDTIVAGQSGDSQAYVFKRSGKFWSHEQSVTALNVVSGDYFGMESTSVDGDTMIVGSPYEDSNQQTITNGTGTSADNTLSNSGAAYIFKRTGSVWTQEAFLKASNANAGNVYFGKRVAVDGDVAIVGVENDASSISGITNGATVFYNTGATGSGAMYIFTRSGTNWSQTAYVKAVNAESLDYFGYSVDVSNDTIIVGSYNESTNETVITNSNQVSYENSAYSSGAAYIYKFDGVNWYLEAFLKPSNTEGSDHFGYSVAIDGELAVVGANQESSNQSTITNGTGSSSDNTLLQSGAAYVYKRINNRWVQDAYLKASNPDISDWFARSVDINGNLIAIGASGEDDTRNEPSNGVYTTINNSGNSNGATYVFKKSAGIWEQSGYLKPSNLGTADGFGHTVKIANTTVAVASDFEDSSNTTISHDLEFDDNGNASSSGAIYVFKNKDILGETQNFKVSSITSSSITFEWEKVPEATGYRIAYQPGESAPANCSSGTNSDLGDVATHTISGLTTDSVYTFRICAYNALPLISEGRVISREIKGVMLDRPENFMAQVETNSSIRLNWEAAGGATTGYRISYAENDASTLNCSDGNSTDVGNVTSYTQTGLAQNNKYDFVICAYDGSGNLSRAVYASSKLLNLWNQHAYINAVNGDVNDYFGTALDLHNDTLVVASTSEDSNVNTITNGETASADNSLTTSGAVYVYRSNSGVWKQEAYIKAANAGGSDTFGFSVSIHKDTLVVGAQSEDSIQNTITNGTGASTDNSRGQSGAAYVYKRTGTTWAQEAYVKAGFAYSNHFFGHDVDIQDDRLVVSAHNEESNQTTITNGTGVSTNRRSSDSGATYVYSRSGVNWSQEAYIKASNNGIADTFGDRISLSGNTLAVSAMNEDSSLTTIINGETADADNSYNASGAVYIYRKDSGVWFQEAYIKASNNRASLNFGERLALDGDTLAVISDSERSTANTITNGEGSSSNWSSSNVGAAYVYKRIGSTWKQQAYIKAKNSGSGDAFGRDVALSGNTLAVSSINEDGNFTGINNGDSVIESGNTSNSGAVYVYKRVGDNWAQEAYIKSPLSEQNDQFGSRIAIHGNLIAVSATASDGDRKIYSGSVNSSHHVNEYAGSGSVFLMKNVGRVFDVPHFRVTGITDSSISFKWDKIEGATGYQITYQSGSTTPATCSSGTTSDLGDVDSATVSALTTAEIYTFKICSYDASANYSPGLSITRVISLSRPPKPLALQIDSKDTSSFDLSWTSGGGTTTGFQLAYAPKGTSLKTCDDGTSIDLGNVSSYTLSGLSEETGYEVKLCAYSATGAYSHEAVTQDYTRSTKWNFDKKIVSVNIGSYDYFGADSGNYYGNLISLDGDTLAVGAYGEDSNVTTITTGTTASANNSLNSSGAAYVYTLIGDEWIQQAYIKASNANANDYFGESISLSGDTLVVGAGGEDSLQTSITNGTTAASTNNTYSSSGATYVYKRTGGIWAQEAYIKTSNAGTSDFFGRSVSIDGDTIVVGAIGEDSNQTTVTNGTSASTNDSSGMSGAAYVYKRTGSTWAQEAYLKGNILDNTDYFARAVAISGDTIAVGADGDDNSQMTITNGPVAVDSGSNYDSGAVYIFKRTGTNWAQEAYIKAANANSNDAFGSALDLNGDILAVGSYLEDSNQNTITNGETASTDNTFTTSGAVYIYQRLNDTWKQQAYIKPSNSGVSQMFGKVVALSSNRLIVGAPTEQSGYSRVYNGVISATATPDASSNIGAAYIFKRTGNNWAQEAYLKSPTPVSGDYFGGSLSIDGVHAVVGAVDQVFVFKHGSETEEVKTFNSVLLSASSIQINWSPVSGASGYKIAYVTGTNPPADCNSGTSIDVGNVSTYAVTGLTDGETYSFRVCHYDGVPNLSNGVTFTRLNTLSYPPRSASIYGSPVSESEISLSWDAAGGSTSGYKLSYIKGETHGGGCDDGTSVTLGNITTHTLTGLDEESFYTFALCSVQSNGVESAPVYSAKIRTNSTKWNYSAYIKASNLSSFEQSVTSLSLYEDTLVVGNMNEDSASSLVLNATTTPTDNSLSNSGAAYVYKRTGDNWQQESFLKGSNNRWGNYFGENVVVGKNIVAVYARDDSDLLSIYDTPVTTGNNNYYDSGAIYLFTRTATTWSQETFIKSFNADDNDYFGSVMDIDGDTLVVGVQAEDSGVTGIYSGNYVSDDNSSDAAGATYIYRKIDGYWEQEAYIKSYNSEAQDNFGSSVSIKGDTLAVSAQCDDSNQTTITNGVGTSSDNSLFCSGSVYIYRRTGTDWEQEAYIKASNADSSDRFGTSVSLGINSLIVGTHAEASNQIGITNSATASADNSFNASGAAYIYSRNGTSWSQEAFLKASNPAVSDQFGRTVAISGQTAVVGAIGEDNGSRYVTNGNVSTDDPTMAEVGAVYVFRKVSGNWTQEAYLKPPVNHNTMGFGHKIDIYGDTIAVGAQFDSCNDQTIRNGTFPVCGSSNFTNTGAVYVFRHKNRLFDTPNLDITDSDSSSVTLEWGRTGGSSVGWTLAYQVGATAPASCNTGTTVALGDVTTHQEMGLVSGQTYSFRVCARDGSNNLSDGSVISVTLP